MVSTTLASGDFTAGASTLLSNYNLPTTASGAGQITADTLTYVADAKSRCYGVANPTFTGTVTGFVNAETQSGATTGTPTWSSSATSSSNVGSYAVTGSGLTANNGNYTFVQAVANATALTITPKTLTAAIINNPTKPYDGNTGATLAPANFQLTGLVGTEAIGVTKSSGTYNSPNVTGATTVSTTLASGDFTAGASTLLSNYNLPTTASGAGQITADTLTYVADPKSRCYREANPTR